MPPSESLSLQPSVYDPQAIFTGGLFLTHKLCTSNITSICAWQNTASSGKGYEFRWKSLSSDYSPLAFGLGWRLWVYLFPSYHYLPGTSPEIIFSGQTGCMVSLITRSFLFALASRNSKNIANGVSSQSGILPEKHCDKNPWEVFKVFAMTPIRVCVPSKLCLNVKIVGSLEGICKAALCINTTIMHISVVNFKDGHTYEYAHSHEPRTEVVWQSLLIKLADWNQWTEPCPSLSFFFFFKFMRNINT